MRLNVENVLRLLHILTIQCVQKKSQKYFLHNVNKFARMGIISGKRHRECAEELLVERTPSLPNQSCYFTL